MSAPVLMVLASLLFASMGVCVKLASALYSTGEIVFYRGLIGALYILLVSRARGGTVRTRIPAMHAWRSVVGVSALMLWFYAISKLPLATAVTLNYMSSVWMALFLIGGAVLLGSARVDPRLVATVLTGFAGVALVLQPTLERDQFQGALAGLLSGMLSAMAYLQVTALGRAGEPDYRIVFYFSVGGMAAGACLALLSGLHPHSATGLALLLATGLLATTAQMMMTRAYAIGRTLSNASLQYLGIVFSFLFGVVWFADPVTWPALLGMALIIGAGLVATRLRQQVAADTPQGTGDS
jgi:drug/metabolite transporter (DMT)-like permease